MEAEGLLVAAGVDGDEGTGEGDNPREPPATAPAAPCGAAVPTLLSASATGNKTISPLERAAVKVDGPYLPPAASLPPSHPSSLRPADVTKIDATPRWHRKSPGRTYVCVQAYVTMSRRGVGASVIESSFSRARERRTLINETSSLTELSRVPGTTARRT